MGDVAGIGDVDRRHTDSDADVCDSVDSADNDCDAVCLEGELLDVRGHVESDGDKCDLVSRDGDVRGLQHGDGDVSDLVHGDDYEQILLMKMKARERRCSSRWRKNELYVGKDTPFC